MIYRKTQIGWIVIGFISPFIIFIFILYYTQWGNNPLPLLPSILISAVFLIFIALFYKLTIEVDQTHLKVIYGVGLIKIKFKIDTLISVHLIKTPWYYGLGIRVTPKGMLYNIQGLNAVEIKFISSGKNKSVMIGSPEPDKLQKVLETNFKMKKQ